MSIQDKRRKETSISQPAQRACQPSRATQPASSTGWPAELAGRPASQPAVANQDLQCAGQEPVCCTSLPASRAMGATPLKVTLILTQFGEPPSWCSESSEKDPWRPEGQTIKNAFACPCWILRVNDRANFRNLRAVLAGRPGSPKLRLWAGSGQLAGWLAGRSAGRLGRLAELAGWLAGRLGSAGKLVGLAG